MTQPVNESERAPAHQTNKKWLPDGFTAVTTQTNTTTPALIVLRVPATLRCFLNTRTLQKLSDARPNEQTHRAD